MKAILTITAFVAACLLGACAKEEQTTTSTMGSTSTGYTK
jgi:hypothetical protein